MMKTTQKALRELIAQGVATDLRQYNSNEAYDRIMKEEGWLTQIAYAHGIYGCNGVLFQGHNTGELYAIPDRSSVLFLYH